MPQRPRTALLRSDVVRHAGTIASAPGCLGVPRPAGLIGIVLIAAASAVLAGPPTPDAGESPSLKDVERISLLPPTQACPCAADSGLWRRASCM